MDEEMIECIQCLYRYKTNRIVQKETTTGIEWVQAVRLVYGDKKFLVKFDPEKFGVIITTPENKKLHGDKNCSLVIYEFIEECEHNFFTCGIHTDLQEAFKKVGVFKVPLIIYTNDFANIDLLYLLYSVGALEYEELNTHPRYNIVEHIAVYDKTTKRFVVLNKETVGRYV